MIRKIIKKLEDFFREETVEEVYQKTLEEKDESTIDDDRIYLVGFYGHPERSNDVIERLYQLGAKKGDGFFDLEKEAANPEKLVYMIFDGNKSTFLIHCMCKKNFLERQKLERGYVVFDIDKYDSLYNIKVGDKVMGWRYPHVASGTEVVGLKFNPGKNRFDYRLSGGEVRDYYELTKDLSEKTNELNSELKNSIEIEKIVDKDNYIINIPKGYKISSVNSETGQINIYMKEKVKENFVITSQEDGKKYWISRSIAVAVVLYGFPAEDSNEHGVFLVHRRGKGCPDNIEKWSTNCGYIGWHETVAQAASRELYEETGLEIPDSHLKFIGYNDPIGDGKENVTLRFIATLPKSLLENSLKSGKINTNTKWRGGEDDEISEFKLIPATEEGVKELGESMYWAFNHDDLLLDVLKKINEIGKY